MSKKRATARRVEDENDELHTPTENAAGHTSQLSNASKSEPNKSSGSRIWSYVSTFLRFASLTPQTDLSMPEINSANGESHVIIKRCASFTGMDNFGIFESLIYF